MTSDITPIRPPRLASGTLATASKIAWSWSLRLRRDPGDAAHMREMALHTLANICLQTSHDRIRRIAEDALKAAATGGTA